MACRLCGQLPTIRGEKLAVALDKLAAAGIAQVEVHALLKHM